MKEPIYLDNAGTTKMFEECADVIKDYACKHFYNPSAGYALAIQNNKLLDSVRNSVLNKLNLNKGNVIFTSGATESNNLAIKGSVRNGKWEYVFSAGEHPSVYKTALDLQLQGAVVHFVPLTASGEIDYDELAKVLNDKTRLISIIHVSNETGAINDLQKISALKKKLAPKALLHIDGVQAFCKIPVDLSKTEVDLYTISAHKFHGPKGGGALFVKNKEALKPIVFGGEQEFGKRSGTENLPAIIAMQYAIEKIDVQKNYQNTQILKNIFLEIFEGNEKIKILETQSPYIVSLSFEGVNGETLMRALEKEVIISTGSACSSKHAGNRILENIGLNKDRIKSSVRISFNAYLTEQEVERAGKMILQVYNEIWEKVK